MIKYKAIYIAKMPDGKKKTSLIFYDTKADAELDAKIMQLTQNNLISVTIEEVSKKL